jgi:hypothetical protein
MRIRLARGFWTPGVNWPGAVVDFLLGGLADLGVRENSKKLQMTELPGWRAAKSVKTVANGHLEVVPGRDLRELSTQRGCPASLGGVARAICEVLEWEA